MACGKVEYSVEVHPVVLGSPESAEVAEVLLQWEASAVVFWAVGEVGDPVPVAARHAQDRRPEGAHGAEVRLRDRCVQPRKHPVARSQPRNVHNLEASAINSQSL